MTSEQFINKYGETFFKAEKLGSFYNDVHKLNSERIESLESQLKEVEEENKKLKEASSILNSLSEEKPCPECNNKMDYKPRLYHCNHCGSDFN